MGTDTVQNNTFKILVATDNHLGFFEKDPERGNDSFNTFEEILELAVANNVDFILLGGDLFHENKPSRSAILKCMELLRKYTFGDRPVCFDFVSDPSENFPHLKNPNVNYQDPNLNVSIPVFSIHGNHDDPSGLGQHSPLEMLSIAGLINYFGRINNLSEITVSPLLFTKGRAKLALYGLSSLKDERLFRLFKEEKVKMLRPKEEMDQWCNVLVLHQNHTKHNISNYIPEEFLDSFLDLVIWGHEHECRLEAKESTHGQFYVTQPGSSVATSLCIGEAVQKQVAILYINESSEMRIVGQPLKTVRPFVFQDLCLKDEDVPEKITSRNAHPVELLVEQKVEALIKEAKEKLTGHPRQPVKPLIRLRVEYTDESQMFNIVRFGYKFAETVANPDSIILFRKYRQDTKKENDGGAIDQDVMDAVLNSEISQTMKVEDLVEQYFSELEGEANQMQLLSERGLAYSVGQFVDKDDRDAIQAMFTHQVDKTVKYLSNLEDLNLDNIEEAIHRFHVERLSKKEDVDEAIMALSDPARKTSTTSSYLDDDFDSDPEIIAETTSTRGRRGGRGSRGARGRGSRGSASNGRASLSANKTQLEMIGDESLVTSRGRGRGRGRGTTTNTAANGKTPSIREAFSKTSARRTASQKSKGAQFYDVSDSD